MLQLFVHNQNFFHDNPEMNNLIESVRYGLKTLLNNEEFQFDQQLLNDLLQVKSISSFDSPSIPLSLSYHSESSTIESNLRETNSIHEM